MRTIFCAVFAGGETATRGSKKHWFKFAWRVRGLDDDRPFSLTGFATTRLAAARKSEEIRAHLRRRIAGVRLEETEVVGVTISVDAGKRVAPLEQSWRLSTSIVRGRRHHVWSLAGTPIEVHGDPDADGRPWTACRRRGRGEPIERLTGPTGAGGAAYGTWQSAARAAIRKWGKR